MFCAMRNDSRNASSTRFPPRAQLIVESDRTAYRSGRGGFAEILGAQQVWFDTRLTKAELRIEREQALVAIEM